MSNEDIEVRIGDLPVMKAHCATCPFKPDDKGIWRDTQLANEVIARTIFNAQQICHGTEGKRRKPRFRCKGAYDHNLEIYIRMFGKDNPEVKAHIEGINGKQT